MEACIVSPPTHRIFWHACACPCPLVFLLKERGRGTERTEMLVFLQSVFIPREGGGGPGGSLSVTPSSACLLVTATKREGVSTQGRGR